MANEVVGTKGRAFILPQFYITGANPWKLEGEPNDAYVTEHTNLINSIRAGKPLNELKQIAESTLVGILGREAAYTGAALTWEQALDTPSQFPKSLEWGPMTMPPVPMPGATRVRRCRVGGGALAPPHAGCVRVPALASWRRRARLTASAMLGRRRRGARSASSRASRTWARWRAS